MTDTFTKTVTIKTVDEEARTATGAVLVADELDHQGDFFRPDAVERFHTPDPDTGVMHSAFPEGAAEMERLEVIDEAETIDGEEFPAGTLVATRRYTDDDLFELVADGILTGFSIGGDIADAREHDTVPDDVRIPDSVEFEREDGAVELVDGSITEISDVDIPAVPRATYKSTLGKSLLDDVEGEAEFVELLVDQRGHEESEARRLYQYLTDVRDKTRRKDVLDSVGKPFESPQGAEFEDFEDCVETLMSDGMEREEAETVCGAWQEEDKQTMSDSTTTDEPTDATKWQILKELVLGSDDADTSAEAPDAAKATDGDDEEEEGDEEEDGDEDEDEMENNKSADMTDDTQSDPPEWAKSLTETVEQIDERVNKLEEDGDEEAEKAMADAPEWAEDLAEKVDDLDERVDAISKQSGHSQQLDAAENNAADNIDETEKFKAGLVGGR